MLFTQVQIYFSHLSPFLQSTTMDYENFAPFLLSKAVWPAP